jgi:CDP-diacylglycerol--serine O-phosphatidyltransferase
MLKAIPHILTLSNLLCGILAIRAIFNGDVLLAITFVFVAAVLDFFDGFVARALGVSGELGKQLDSLADNVTFGVVPALMFLRMADFLPNWPTSAMGWALFGAALFVAAMATLRLAIFNIDVAQQSGFRGMPTPGNTLFVASLYYLFFLEEGSWATNLLQNELLLLGIILLSALWQVAPVQLMALKFTTWAVRPNLWRYLFIVFSAGLFILLFIPAIPIIILLYLIFSVAYNSTNKQS